MVLPYLHGAVGAPGGRQRALQEVVVGMQLLQEGPRPLPALWRLPACTEHFCTTHPSFLSLLHKCDMEAHANHCMLGAY